jgi:hypothetical protein
MPEKIEKPFEAGMEDRLGVSAGRVSLVLMIATVVMFLSLMPALMSHEPAPFSREAHPCDAVKAGIPTETFAALQSRNPRFRSSRSPPLMLPRRPRIFPWKAVVQRLRRFPGAASSISCGAKLFRVTCSSGSY